MPEPPMPILADLYQAIAALLEEGSEPVALAGAEAMRRHAGHAMPCGSAGLDIMDIFLPGLLAPDAHPVSAVLHPVFGQLNWRFSGSENGRIRHELSVQMLTSELVGPTGIVFDPTCRVGLFAQNAHLDYPERTHAAEELFVMLSGSAMWKRHGHGEVIKGAGGRIHHQSREPHASRTLTEPFVAVWVWTGDIDFDTYELHG